MSKSRGNFLDPTDVVAAFGADGARYVSLREVPFDKDAEVSWDSFVRRYNADLANDFGNLVNRTVSMAGRYLGGRRPRARAATDAPLAAAWAASASATYADRSSMPCCSTTRSPRCGSSSARRTGSSRRSSRGRSPRPRKGGRRGGRRPGAARGRARRPRRGRPARRRSRPRRSCPRWRPARWRSSATTTRTRRDGNGGPPLLDELEWGRHAGETGTLGAPEPLFPRLETEAAAAESEAAAAESEAAAAETA